MINALVGEFGDRFDRTQIEALMSYSVTHLAGRANVSEFLPVLAYRFTRERLRSPSRASGSDLDIVFVSLSCGGPGQIAAALTTMLSGGQSLRIPREPRTMVRWIQLSRRSSQSSGSTRPSSRGPSAGRCSRARTSSSRLV